MLVNGTVIHDNDRVWRGKGIHLLQEISNERDKKFGIEGAFDNEALDDTIDRDGRQYRVARSTWVSTA